MCLHLRQIHWCSVYGLVTFSFSSNNENSNIFYINFHNGTFISLCLYFDLPTKSYLKFLRSFVLCRYNGFYVLPYHIVQQIRKSFFISTLEQSVKVSIIFWNQDRIILYMQVHLRNLQQDTKPILIVFRNVKYCICCYLCPGLFRSVLFCSVIVIDHTEILSHLFFPLDV